MMLGGDERLCKALIPNFPLGTRRMTPAPGYLEALRKDNVEVVVGNIKRFLADGIEMVSGEVLKVDTIICATGFDISFRPRFPLVGREGNLQDIWSEETPKAYMSCAVAGMPNYFSKPPHSPTPAEPAQNVSKLLTTLSSQHSSARTPPSATAPSSP